MNALSDSYANNDCRGAWALRCLHGCQRVCAVSESANVRSGAWPEPGADDQDEGKKKLAHTVVYVYIKGNILEK